MTRPHKPRFAFRHASFGEIVWPFVLTILTVTVHITLILTSLGYAELFQGIGGPLPLLTQFFLPNFMLYFVLPTISVLALIYGFTRRRVSTSVYVVCAVISALMVPTFVYAMYLPVWQLGDALVSSKLTVA